ncbi:MAG: hypothetical protein Q8L02_04585 [Candidatus Nitrotoga sp.]|nr:hypothetical protein [Candidatus Nitrotoga sp.]
MKPSNLTFNPDPPLRASIPVCLSIMFLSSLRLPWSAGWLTLR